MPVTEMERVSTGLIVAPAGAAVRWARARREAMDVAAASPLAGGAPGAAEVELVIGGRTCAACAARVQAKLNKLDGVTASVNLSTERAYVPAPAQVCARDLIDVVAR